MWLATVLQRHAEARADRVVAVALREQPQHVHFAPGKALRARRFAGIGPGHRSSRRICTTGRIASAQARSAPPDCSRSATRTRGIPASASRKHVELVAVVREDGQSHAHVDPSGSSARA